MLSLQSCIFNLIRARRVFIPKMQYIEKARKYCSMYYWGGRQEQELMAEMRKRKEANSEIVTNNADIV